MSSDTAPTSRQMSTDVGRCRQMSADVGRCRQMSADVGRCRQMSADVSRCRQMSADVGRCRQMSADVGRCRQGGAAAGGKGCGCLLRWRRCTGQCALRRDPGDAGVGDPHRCGLRDLFWRLSSCNATQQKINRNQQTIEKRNKNTKRILES